MLHGVKKKTILCVKIFLTALILWVLYHQSQLQFGLLLTFVTHYWITLAVFGLCYMMVFFHAWRWYRLNRAQHLDLSLWQTMIPAYTGIAFNNVLPGSIGGDLFRLYFVLKKFPTKKSNTVISIFADRITGLLGILVIACVVAPFYLEVFKENAALYFLLLFSMTFCAVSLLAALLLAFLLSEKVNLTNKIQAWFAKRTWSSRLLPVFQAIHIYRNAKLIIVESVLMSIATQMLLLMVVIFITKAMSLPALPLGVYLLALVMGQIANLVPITPGGLGVGEAAFANVILLLYPAPAMSYATVFFGLRILSMLAYLPGVVLGLIRFDKLHKNPQLVLENANI